MCEFGQLKIKVQKQAYSLVKFNIATGESMLLMDKLMLAYPPVNTISEGLKDETIFSPKN